MTTAIEPIPDEGVAEFLDLAKSASVYFEIVNDRLTIRAVNPDWTMWAPVRHMLDEIGTANIERVLRRTTHPA